MLERVYVLSHTDLDGYFSAGLTEVFYKIFRNKDATFKHKSWTYGRDLPSTDYIKNNFDTIFIVDLCPDFDFMYNLWEKFQDKFIWIDHHVKPDKEFLERFSKLSASDICGIRETVEHHRSAAALVYSYFEHQIEIPDWLRYISDFDCWNRTDEEYWNNKVMPMFSYLKSVVTSPQLAVDYINNRINEGQFYDEPDEINYHKLLNNELEVGKIMYDCTKSSFNSDAKHGFERVFESVDAETGDIKKYKAWICNTQNRSSVLFEDMPNRDDYDVFIPYHFNGEKYMYSMYTFKNDIHCNKMNIWKDMVIVASFNGHKDAAGSNSEKFIF